MSDLRPKGAQVEIGGVNRHFLFTLNAIDTIQSEKGMPVSNVMELLQDEAEVPGTVRYLATVLINDEIERENARTKGSQATLTEKEVGWLIEISEIGKVADAIMIAYGISLPDNEDEDPNGEGSRSS